MNRTFGSTVFVAASFALAIGLSPRALAADAAKEASTAGMHAGLAATQAKIEMVKMHLHHAVNCLVGPKGKGFDAAQANPCAKDGNGAIPDATDAAEKAKYEKAAKTAEEGIKATDLAAAQKAASETAAALK